ncbi:MAG: transglutaminase domain-containing protein [Elusimicrobia bacterium]|nr:transglutaminase domain-containing protein [Elusimicrobiota bacterium]
MNTPPLLLGAALLFWGSQTGFWALAVPCALLLEASRLLRSRWELSDADFHRIADFSTALFLGALAYAVAARSGRPGVWVVMRMFSLLPMCLFPLLAAQACSVQGRVDLGAFSYILRMRSVKASRLVVDMAYPYFVLCILGASTANLRTSAFYAGMLALAAWALFGLRRRGSSFSWALTLAAAGALGYAGHVGLHSLQDVVVMAAAKLVFGTPKVFGNPFRGDTAIGRIGELKRFDRIVLRVRPSPGTPAPHLLREMSFNVNKGVRWFPRDFRSVEVPPGEREGSWEIAAQPAQTVSSVAISGYFKDGRGLLALPPGSFRVDDLPAAGVSRSRLGAVEVKEGPGFAEALVRYGGLPPDGAPDASDLEVPAEHKSLFAPLASKLGLAGKPPRAALEKVAAYFGDGFSYSTYQDAKKIGPKPLEDFLLRNRSGHCEYYAAVTALLLREAGIPARYATGYSVQEYGKIERAFVVRRRHAHAWVLAWVDGAWRDFDTTPPSGLDAENEALSMGRPLRDLWSWCVYRFSKWRWSRRPGAAGGRTAALILLPVAAFLAWRLSLRLRTLRRRMAEAALAKAALQGSDSEFFGVERALSKEGLGRRPWEPASDWLRRLPPERAGGLRRILQLHNRYRFDPDGIAAEDRRALRDAATAWLESRAR